MSHKVAYHKGKDILKKTGLFVWMLELYRLILVITRFLAENKFQLGVGAN